MAFASFGSGLGEVQALDHDRAGTVFPGGRDDGGRQMAHVYVGRDDREPPWSF